jgi:hypothetical protein
VAGNVVAPRTFAVTTIHLLDELVVDTRRRRQSSLVALALPWTVVLCAVAWRAAGPGAAAITLAATLAAMLAFAARAARHFDATWAARQLDDRRSDLEDSAGLLLRPVPQLNPLQRLQRARVERRLADVPPPDLRPAWPSRALAVSWTLCAALVATALLLPPRHDAAMRNERPAVPSGPSAVGGPRLVEQHLDIAPPAYTGLPARSEDSLDAKLPSGSRLRWRLRFEPQPSSVQLEFHDQSRATLVATDGVWTAERTLDRSMLYRVVLDGDDTAATRAPRHRLEVIADQPPSIRVVAPTQNVTLHEPGQRQWLLQFEASDDYGLGAARLHVTHAQGGGENVTVTDRVLQIRGDGDHRQQRYTHRLDLGALGLAAGDDLIVRLSVDDNRSPTPNSSRSASLILRWPPATGAEPTGMEGMVRQTLPAYFRSQRQVIIDTEALIAQRTTIPADRFASRSDEIGVDQRLLRLRYGQFLGEEAEEARNAATDGHDHEAADDESGASDSVLEQFGHTHDIPEAATLLDRETRELLRSALGEMWQAELHLRQGHPSRALPFEYRALERIKQVQQASRIYLARLGLELPPIDATRRLSGDASGVRSRGDALAAATTETALPAEWWQRLGDSLPTVDGAGSNPPAPDLGSLAAWVRAREAQLPQALELLAAIDALGSDPRCDDCRQRLRALLWPLLPTPATASGSRAAPNASGAAYLDALQSEASR